jgi:PAS domain S-box-containing protein
VNEVIYGVLELASFEPFEPYQLDLVHKVSESIAATISTVRVYIRTERLLVQTRLQAEEMANAEEELRQSMEEMQSTQEESRRREIELSQTLENIKLMQAEKEEKDYELQQVLSGLDKTYNIIQFSSDAIITEVNQNLANLFRSEKSAFIGKHMSSFMGAEEFNKAWNAITQGKTYEVSTQIDADGRKMDVKQTFMPVCDINGKLLSVTLFAVHDQEAELHQNLEEMKTQEEEIRQTMEEMQATQEDTRRREGDTLRWKQSILDAISSPINVVDLDKRITFTNSAALAILGKTREEVIGKHCGDVWGVDICKDHRCGIECLKRGEKEAIFNAGDKTYSSAANYIKDHDGNVIGYIEVVSDITDSKK